MTASLFTRSRTIGSVSSRVRSIDFCTLRHHFLVLWLDGSPACLPQPAASKKGLRCQSVLRWTGTSSHLSDRPSASRTRTQIAHGFLVPFRSLISIVHLDRCAEMFNVEHF